MTLQTISQSDQPDGSERASAARRICAALLPEIGRQRAMNINFENIAKTLSCPAVQVLPSDVEEAIAWGGQLRFLNGYDALGADVNFGSVEISSVLDNTVAHMPLLGQALRRLQLLIDDRDHLLAILASRKAVFERLQWWKRKILELLRLLPQDTLPSSRNRFDDYLTTVTLPENWSERACYRTLHSTCENHDASFFQPENLPGCLAPAYRDMFHDFELGAAITCAENVSVCYKIYSSVRHHSGRPDKDQLFFHFSRNGDFLYKNNYLSTDVDSIRFFQGSPLRGRAKINELNLFDWSTPRDYDRNISGEFVFIGSRSNFGHFLFDHLPNLYFTEKYPELSTKPLVFGKLSEWQKECLDVLGVSSNYIELDEPQNQGITRIEKLWIPTRMPMIFRINYIRERIQRSYPKTPGVRRLFLSRAKFDNAFNRIANESEIIALAISRGFDVVYPEEMSIAEKIEIFSKAAIVLSGAGSSEANFWAFAHPCSILVSLYPEFFFRSERHLDRSVMYTLGYHVPILERVVFVPGVQDEKTVEKLYKTSEFQVVDCPAQYQRDLVERALEEAEVRFTANTKKRLSM